MSTQEKGTFFQGKTPRNAILGVGLVAALVVGSLGIYYQAKQDSEAKVNANAKKSGEQQYSRKPDDGNNQDINALINQQKTEAEMKARQAQRQQPMSLDNPNSDTFVPASGARGNRQVSPGGDEDGVYSAGIFKSGGHQIQNKFSAAGVGGLTANAAGNLPTPDDMKAAQDSAAGAVQDALAATQDQAMQAAQDRNISGSTTSGAASQQSDLSFLRKAKQASQSGEGFSTASFVGQEKPCTLAPPNHIPVLTIEKLNSDRPGTASLLVTEDVYDSVTGTCLMIPKGSKITAPYSSDIRVGAESILVAGTELRLPNGKEVPLNGAEGADQDGEAGFSGGVNNHFLKIFGTSFLTAILVGVFDHNSTVATTASPYGVTQVGSTAGQVAAQTSQSVLSRYQSIPPTITIKPGLRFMIKVNQDIHLEPYHG
jgi:type IV secretion system protein TrbI